MCVCFTSHVSELVVTQATCTSGGMGEGPGGDEGAHNLQIVPERLKASVGECHGESSNIIQGGSEVMLRFQSWLEMPIFFRESLIMEYLGVVMKQIRETRCLETCLTTVLLQEMG